MKPSQAHAFARSDRSPVGVWWWTTDRWMLGAVAALIAIGVMMSFAASPSAAARMNVGDPFHFAVRQCVFAAAGAMILVSTSMLDGRGVRRAAFFIYLIAIAIMIALPFMGHTAKGATRWVQLGGFTLQPSEFMKPALIVLVSWMFAEGQKGQGVPGVSIAFGLYFTIARARGYALASYISALTPPIAMLVSVMFEGARFGVIAFAGLALVLAGQLFLIRAPKRSAA